MTTDRYTHGHHDAVLRSHRWRTVENSARYLVPHLDEGARLLDVGCGPGTLTVDLARRLRSGQVLGIDRDQGIVDEAFRHATESTVTNVETRIGDVYQVDEPSGSFDIAHAHQVLQHLSDPVRALEEMARLVGRGGLVAARDADYGAMTWYPSNDCLDRWREVYQSVARANGAEPDAGRRLLAWGRSAGFTDITASASTWCFADDETRRWWGELWATRMTESAVADQAIQLGVATGDDLATLARGFTDWAENPDGWFLVPHGEIIARP